MAPLLLCARVGCNTRAGSLLAPYNRQSVPVLVLLCFVALVLVFVCGSTHLWFKAGGDGLLNLLAGAARAPAGNNESGKQPQCGADAQSKDA